MDQQLYDLPDGWEWSLIDNLCEKITDGTHKTPTYIDEGIPFLSVKDMSKGFIDFSNTRFISEKEHLELFKRCNPEYGDVLYSKVGTTGVAQIVDTKTEFSLFVSVALLKPKHNIIDSKFLEKMLNSPNVYEQAQDKTRGVANRNLVLKDIKSIILTLPPLPEQKRIVEKLDALLSRIDQAVNNLQESLGLAEALFASELNIVFSVIEDRQEIAALAEVKGGKRLPKGCQLQDEKTDYPYIRVSDFNDNGSIDVLNVKFITKEVQEKISRYTITNQDLYISIAGTIGKTGFVPQELDGANLTENAAKLVIKNRDTLFLNYLYYFTKTSDFASQAGLATKQVAQPKLALTRLSKIQIPLCDISQQKRIVKKLDQVAKNKEELKDKLQGQIDDLNALKASLLDAAFCGEL